MKIQKGDSVTYIGCSREQIRWGSNDDPNNLLSKYENYVVEDLEYHTSHTKIKLVGYEGKFNSICFMKRNLVKNV